MRRIVTVLVMYAVMSVLLQKPTLAEENNEDRSLDIGKIVITPSKIGQAYEDLPLNVSVVNAQAVEDSGATELAAVLDRLPSVDIIDYGADGAIKTIHTRGLSGSQVLTLLDGIVVNTPRDGTADLNKLDLNNVERIEVLRGPAASIYGSSAMGGVVNIITKDGKSYPKTMVKAKYGSNATREIAFAHGQDLGIFDYYFSHDTYKSDGHRSNSDYEYHNTSLKLGYNPEEKNRLSLGYGYFQSELGTLGPSYWEDGDDRQEGWRENFDLTWQAALNEKSDILVRLYHNIDHLEFIENRGGDIKDTHHTKLYGAEAQLTKEIFDSLRFTGGYNYQQYGLNSSASAKHEYSLNAFYAEGEIAPWEKLKVYLGGRFDDYSNFSERLTPSARFSWWLSENFKAHGLYAHSFRVPTFNDLYWPREDWGIFGGVEGNLDLRAETAKSYELGISTYFFKALWTDLTFFRNDIEDMIIWNVDQTNWWRPQNLASAIVQGVEWNSDFALWQKIKANFSYTFLYAKDKDSDKWLIYRPQHQYKLNLNYHSDSDWTVDYSWRYITKRFAVDDNTSVLDHYWVADISIGKKLFDIWELQVSVKNLFDRLYEEEADYPMPDRQVLMELKCEF
ncbi:MAG: TonB-dependent receptor [Candidatus Omnitrophota bacterium]